jgi:AraC-like DNA-binding protein
MNRFVSLHRTHEFLFGRFDHPLHEPHTDPATEASDSFSLSLVESGSFTYVQGRSEHQLGPGDLLLTAPGTHFRIRHEQQFPRDSCLTLSIRFPATSGARELARRMRVAPVRRPATRCRFIFRMASHPAPMSICLEAAVLQLCSDLLHEDTPDGVFACGDYAAVHRRMEEACTIFEQEFDRSLSLGHVARRVRLSPFHFARLFTATTGTSPHRFLVRVRLLHALRSLRNGASVTDACFGSGFSHLSHFSSAFQRTFGVLPSAILKMASADSKKLIAHTWIRG